MDCIKDLLRPGSLGEALGILARDPSVIPFAGGTDVFVKLRKTKPDNVSLMSLAGISDLRGISFKEDGSVRIGALTTFTELSSDPVIAEELPMLKTAALSMGGPQIRNVATIGGNICNGAVSADSAPSLLALDAELLIRSRDGERRIPARDFYLGPGKTVLRPGELLIEIVIPPRTQSFGGVYKKFAARKAMDLAILSVAAVCSVDEDGVIKNAAVALGVAAPTPIRCPMAERMLKGKILSDDLAAEAGEAALKEASPRGSARASKRYRSALIKELTARALLEAYKTAGGNIK